MIIGLLERVSFLTLKHQASAFKVVNLNIIMGVVEEKDIGKLSSFFAGVRGQRLARFIMHIFAVDKVNRVYDNSSGYRGADFSERLLQDLGVKYVIGNAGRLEQLPEGAFITVSNHPYGGLDGIMLIDLMARLRNDYRLIVSEVLSLVKTMEGNFISVTKEDNKKGNITGMNVHSLRTMLLHLEEDHPLGFFPSGAVSDFHLKDFRVKDREWLKSILHIIKTARVPVIPLRFFDGNTPFFYFLGLINWKIRLLRQPAELFNKTRRIQRIGIGRTITVEEQDKFSDAESLGRYLRKAVYEMPVPEDFMPFKHTTDA